MLLFQVAPVRASPSVDAIPSDLVLEELKHQSTGDVIVDSRIVADPTTGRVWEIRKHGDDIQVLHTSKFKPWKPKKKLHRLDEILKMEPPKP